MRTRFKIGGGAPDSRTLTRGPMPRVLPETYTFNPNNRWCAWMA